MPVNDVKYLKYVGGAIADITDGEYVCIQIPCSNYMPSYTFEPVDDSM
jgi:hypothetical protein